MAHPGWHVLPVQVAETPLAEVPAYLRALTIMQAEGNLAAEVVLEVEDRCAPTLAPARPQQPQSPTSEPVGPRYRSMQLRFARDAGPLFDRGAQTPGGGHESETLALDPATLEARLWSDARTIDGSARRATPDAGSRGFAARRAKCARAWRGALQGPLRVSPGRVIRGEPARHRPAARRGLRFVINTTDAPRPRPPALGIPLQPGKG